MFSDSEFLRAAFNDPTQLWRYLDSFWRQYTSASTQNLVKYQTFGNLTLFLNTHSRMEHFLQANSIQEATPFWNAPWWLTVIYEDQTTQGTSAVYGGPYHYGGIPPPLIQYGALGGTVWKTKLAGNFDGFGLFTDAIVSPVAVITPDRFSFDASTGVLIFYDDLFSIFPVKTDSTGRRYITLWAKNALVDLDVLFQDIGWVYQLKGSSSETYAKLLKRLAHLVMYGPNKGDLCIGLMDSVGAPHLEVAEEILYRVDDGSSWNFITSDETARGSNAFAPNNNTGDKPLPSDSLLGSVRFFERPDLLAAVAGSPLGIPINHVFNDGSTAQLVFRNFDTIWSINNSVTPFDVRFPMGGAVASVNQFWNECYARQVASGVNLQTLLGITGPGDVVPVNPMKFYVQNFLSGNVFCITTAIAATVDGVQAFFDRARKLLPVSTYILLEQAIGNLSDIIDLGTSTSEIVTYGYHTSPPTEIITSPATEGVPLPGPNLQFFAYTPFVSCA